VERRQGSTQQVTNLGTLVPARAIQIVLTTTLFPCRLTVAAPERVALMVKEMQDYYSDQIRTLHARAAAAGAA
jgi:hypothetical protein